MEETARAFSHELNQQKKHRWNEHMMRLWMTMNYCRNIMCVCLWTVFVVFSNLWLGSISTPVGYVLKHYFLGRPIIQFWTCSKSILIFGFIWCLTKQQFTKPNSDELKHSMRMPFQYFYLFSFFDRLFFFCSLIFFSNFKCWFLAIENVLLLLFLSTHFPIHIWII